MNSDKLHVSCGVIIDRELWPGLRGNLDFTGVLRGYCSGSVEQSLSKTLNPKPLNPYP